MIELTIGDVLESKAAVILLHGRGSSAEDMAQLWNENSVPKVAAIIPEASGNTWYPYSFLAPVSQNQPYLDSALQRVGEIIAGLESKGIPSERVAILGFSQGACLASEYARSHPGRFGALIILTGGVVGPLGSEMESEGSLDGTPVFIGTSEPDPHVPAARVEETKALFERMGATVTLKKYRGMPHGVNQEEIEFAKSMITKITEVL